MTLEDILHFISNDNTILLLFFLVLPVATLLLTNASSGRSLAPPFSYLYSIVLFLVCIPAVLSLTLWGYSIFFESMALWELPFFIYYLPIIIMVVCLYYINKRRVPIRQLPWSGELYELLILIIISFASILIIMKLEILNFRSPWQLILFFLIFLAIIRFSWKRFIEITP